MVYSLIDLARILPSDLSPLVLDMVCYPFISKEEYLEKHLNIISEEAYTIFSEDLDDGDLLNKKINTVFEKNNLIPHSDFTYDLMLRIRRNYEPDLMKKNEYADAITPYSKLFFLPSSVDASKCKEVVDMYAAGVKTVVFVERRESFKSILSYLDYFLKKMNIGYKKNNLFVGSSEKMEKHYEDDIFRIFNFELYMYSALSRICETSFEIVEGKVTDAVAMRAWRFWASFLGFGYLQDMFIIPNACVFLEDVILSADLEKKKMYTVSEFVNAISPMANIIIPDAVISILWALAICSKKKLPVIIDTPLSRLDSLHRAALIKTYFPNAGEQTIILSTDSEIDSKYYQLMKDDIGDEFTLNYDERTKSTSIERGYLIGLDK